MPADVALETNVMWKQIRKEECRCLRMHCCNSAREYPVGAYMNFPVSFFEANWIIAIHLINRRAFMRIPACWRNEMGLGITERRQELVRVGASLT